MALSPQTHALLPLLQDILNEFAPGARINANEAWNYYPAEIDGRRANFVALESVTNGSRLHIYLSRSAAKERALAEGGLRWTYVDSDHKYAIDVTAEDFDRARNVLGRLIRLAFEHPPRPGVRQQRTELR